MKRNSDNEISDNNDEPNTFSEFIDRLVSRASEQCQCCKCQIKRFLKTDDAKQMPHSKYSDYEALAEILPNLNDLFEHYAKTPAAIERMKDIPLEFGFPVLAEALEQLNMDRVVWGDLVPRLLEEYKSKDTEYKEQRRKEEDESISHGTETTGRVGGAPVDEQF